MHYQGIFRGLPFGLGGAGKSASRRGLKGTQAQRSVKVIVDECLPNRHTKVLFRHGYEAVLVQKAGYGGLKDGAPLREIQGKFDAFITVDGNLTYQQNLSRSQIDIIVLVAFTNTFDDVEPLIPDILRVLGALEPGDVIHVGRGVSSWALCCAQCLRYHYPIFSVAKKTSQLCASCVN